MHLYRGTLAAGLPPVQGGWCGYQPSPHGCLVAAVAAHTVCYVSGRGESLLCAPVESPVAREYGDVWSVPHALPPMVCTQDLLGVGSVAHVDGGSDGRTRLGPLHDISFCATSPTSMPTAAGDGGGTLVAVDSHGSIVGFDVTTGHEAAGIVRVESQWRADRSTTSCGGGPMCVDVLAHGGGREGHIACGRFFDRVVSLYTQDRYNELLRGAYHTYQGACV